MHSRSAPALDERGPHPLGPGQFGKIGPIWRHSAIRNQRLGQREGRSGW